MPEPDWDQLFERIKKRFGALGPSRRRTERFLEHVRNLGEWEIPFEINEENVPDFPRELYVALAICHSDCGAKEFIVDGSTQECQHCGRLMFRTQVERYTKS